MPMQQRDCRGPGGWDRVSLVENFEYQGNKVRIEGEDKIKFTRKVAEFAVEDLVASRVK